MWNNVISAEVAKYSSFDAGDFYLEISLPEYQYKKMPLKIIPEQTIEQYGLRDKAYKEWVAQEKY